MKKNNILALMFAAVSSANASDFSQLHVSSHPSMREIEESSCFSVLHQPELSKSYILLQDANNAVIDVVLFNEHTDPKYQSFNSPAISWEEKGVSVAHSKDKNGNKIEEVKANQNPISSMFLNFKDHIIRRSAHQAPPQSVQLAMESMKPKEFIPSDPSSVELSVELKDESSLKAQDPLQPEKGEAIPMNPQLSSSIKPAQFFNMLAEEESIYQDEYSAQREQKNNMNIMDRIAHDIEKLVANGEVSYDAAREDDPQYGKDFMRRVLTKLAQKPEYAKLIDEVIEQYQEPQNEILKNISITQDESSYDGDDMELLSVLNEIQDANLDYSDPEDLQQDMRSWAEDGLALEAWIETDINQTQPMCASEECDKQLQYFQQNRYSINEKSTDKQKKSGQGNARDQREIQHTVSSCTGQSCATNQRYSVSNIDYLQDNGYALNKQNQFDEEEGCDPDLCHAHDPAQIMLQEDNEIDSNDIEDDSLTNNDKPRILIVSLDEDEEGNIDIDLPKSDNQIKVREDYQADFPLDDAERGFKSSQVSLISEAEQLVINPRASSQTTILNVADVTNHINTTHEVHIDCARHIIQSNMSQFYSQNTQSSTIRDAQHPMQKSAIKSNRNQSTSKKLGVSSGDGSIEEQGVIGIWAMPIISSSHQDGVANKITGYKVNTSGIMVGIDKELQSNAMVGVAFTQVNSDVIFDKNAGQNDISSSIFSIYGNQLFANNFFAQGLVNVGFNKNQQLSSTTRNGCGGELIGGYMLPINNQRLSATCGIDFSYLSGSTSQAKDATQSSSQNLRALIGLRYELDKIMSYGALVNPEIHFIAKSNLNNQENIPAGIDYNWRDPEYMSYGTSDTSYNVGLGLNSKISNLQYSLIYDTFLGNKFRGQQLALKLKVEF